MKLELHATPEEVMRAVAALRKFGEDRELPANLLFGLTLALEESASNIVNHALKRDPDQTFQVVFEHTGRAMIIELRDSGVAFDPTQAATSDGIAADDEPPGGWGIFLVRKYTDEMHYVRDRGENVLRLIKRLSPPC
ncbi:MAG: ATP-binding protein [Verrucomicrobia bacterium]|nr:ATP-binding protein [Verrucomicrobiota bacterium]